jgi:hypothetical protein
VLLDTPAGLLEIPAGHPGEQVHPGTTTASVVFAAALVAIPAAVAIVLIPAVAILTTTCGAWLVFIGELLRR